jgi:hypothetical protein
MDGVSLERRLLVMAPLLSALAARGAEAGPIDQRETLVLPPDQIRFQAWGNLPPASGEMAKLYGDFDEPGPYLVVMKWNPGWFSAPHSYRTDRIQVVVSRISTLGRRYLFRQAALSCATRVPRTTTACPRMETSRL